MTGSSTQTQRRHRVFITDNTEYHMRDHVCVAVRGRNGRWLANHAAKGHRVVALVERDGIWRLANVVKPQVGMRLCFDVNLVTTAIRTIERPSVSAVQTYRQLGVIS